MKLLCILFGLFGYVNSFVMFSSFPKCPSSSLFLVDDDQADVLFGSSTLDATASASATEDSLLFESLKERQKSLKHGIGKRYVARTQKGFLNVHYEPSDPFDTENIVSQLSEGEIVTSTGPSRGPWIPHDGGGWSVSKFNGFNWLEPIDE